MLNHFIIDSEILVCSTYNYNGTKVLSCTTLTRGGEWDKYQLIQVNLSVRYVTHCLVAYSYCIPLFSFCSVDLYASDIK
jgi:hypothetical protein